MRLADGDTLDDALELFHSHSWVEQKPELSAVQLAELIPVLAPLFQESRSKSRTAKPKPKVDRGSQTLGRDFVYGRSGGWCEIALLDICAGLGAEWHHRLNRSQGGRWDASNGLHVCKPCHAYVTDAERAEAKAKGWAVPPGRTPPIEVPVLRRGAWVLLDDEGGLEPAVGMVA